MSQPGHNFGLASFSHAQRERLAYLELRLRFIGEVQRADLIQRFGVQTAAATRDLALYRELAPGNLHYDPSAKRHVPGERFRPLFELSASRVFSFLSEGFSAGAVTSDGPWLSCDRPAALGQPSLEVLASVTRAICAGRALAIDYHCEDTGLQHCEIVPFALVDTGLHWQVRAFDRSSGRFGDFVLTRIAQPLLLPPAPLPAHERPEQDIQWTRIVELELVPHPDRPRPELVALDYGMAGGMLRLRLRAATAGYSLRLWQVDCSPDHSLRGEQYRLWLREPWALYGVASAALAPGYQPPLPPEP